MTMRMRTRFETMKVLHVAEVLGGGIATYIDELVREQIKLYGGENIRILCARQELGYLSAEIRNSVGIVVFDKKTRGLISCWNLWCAFRRHQAEWEPYIVHSHSTFAGLLTRIRRSNAKLVYTPNGWAFLRPTSRILRGLYVAIERILAKHTAAIIAVSFDEGEKAPEHGIWAEKTSVVHTGLRQIKGLSSSNTGCEDTPLCSGNDVPKLIMIARFERQKSHGELITALASLKELSWELVLVGDGYCRAYIESQVECLGLLKRVSFLGRRDDVLHLLEGADIFVMPSKYEGFSLSILEAMRAGLPIVVSDVSGNSEAVMQGLNGFLVPPGAVDDLAGSLRRLIVSESLRDQMGAASRARFENKFSSQAMAEEIRKVYAEIV